MEQAPEHDRRNTVRTRRPIDVEYSANCPWIKARLDDLSETGAFIDTQHALGEGAEMVLRFSLPDESGKPQEVRCRARVVWRETMVGIGVEFVELSEDASERIRDVVARDLFGW